MESQNQKKQPIPVYEIDVHNPDAFKHLEEIKGDISEADYVKTKDLINRVQVLKTTFLVHPFQYLKHIS